MPPKHTCKRCDYSTTRLSNMRSHLNRGEVCHVTKEDIPIETLREEYNMSVQKTKFTCPECNASYSNSSGLSYHVTRCTVTPEVKIERLKKTVEEQEAEMSELRQELEEHKKTVEERDAEMSELRQELEEHKKTLADKNNKIEECEAFIKEYEHKLAGIIRVLFI